MESTQIQALYEPPLAAMPQLSEKPRYGFETWKTEAKPGSSSCNFTVALGLRATVVENGVRETYSARYYNPNTGRFMSRDPYDGDVFVPSSLHKYLYVGGDPINLFDPSGRDAVEYSLLEKILLVPIIEAAVDLPVWMGATTGLTVVYAINCKLIQAANFLYWVSTGKSFGPGINLCYPAWLVM